MKIPLQKLVGEFFLVYICIVIIKQKTMTAEEFSEKWNGSEIERSIKFSEYPDTCSQDLYDLMREFAKYHVKKALKAKIEAMREDFNDGGYSLDELDAFSGNAYPLTNIK